MMNGTELASLTHTHTHTHTHTQPLALSLCLSLSNLQKLSLCKHGWLVDYTQLFDYCTVGTNQITCLTCILDILLSF